MLRLDWTHGVFLILGYNRFLCIPIADNVDLDTLKKEGMANVQAGI
jgi:hypothetical protein